MSDFLGGITSRRLPLLWVVLFTEIVWLAVTTCPPRITRSSAAITSLRASVGSDADGKNIIRGLIARGHSDAAITHIAGQNAIDLLRRTIG